VTQKVLKQVKILYLNIQIQCKIYTNDTFKSFERRLVYIVSADEAQTIAFVPAGLVFATDQAGDDGQDGADPAEEEKKSTGSRKKSKDAKVDAKAKPKKKEPNKENVLNKCAAQAKGKQITTLEEFKGDEVYYLVY